MFLGRQKELSELKKAFASKSKTAVLVYGKRRVGKSTLIREASRSFDGVVINHLCVKSTFEGNLAHLSRSVCNALDLPQVEFHALLDVFDFLKKQKKPILLVLDEYQYLKESLADGAVDSYMQIVVDSLPANVKLVFCGSYIAIMKELLKESNPLFGRLSHIISVEEFDYLDASLFYPKLSIRDKIMMYAVFGGSPYVLSLLDFDKSAVENIENLLVEDNSLLRTHVENVVLREIQKAYDVRILEALGNGKKRYSEIRNRLGGNDSGLLDKQLKNLMNMDVVAKVFPINKPNDKKKVFYEIRDNLMRFYFAYIFGQEALISKFGDKAFVKRNVLPSLRTFVSLRFENMVLQYFARLARSGNLDGCEDFGSFWYDDLRNKTNGQFDCVLKNADGYDFFEVKYYDSPMSRKECEKEELQVRAVAEVACRSVGFVCSSGFDFKSRKYRLITGKEIYECC